MCPNIANWLFLPHTVLKGDPIDFRFPNPRSGDVKSVPGKIECKSDFRNVVEG
jgi:hypothetical protein